MKVKIEIECEDLYAVTQHLDTLKVQIKKSWNLKAYSALVGKVSPEGVKTILQDANCYGTHRAVFINEDKTAQT